MKVITDTEEAFATLTKYVAKEKPAYCAIMTFGVYVGILDDGRDCHAWGGKYTNAAHTFLDTLTKWLVDTRIIVGIPTLIECRPGCKDCRTKYEAVKQRISRTVKVYTHKNMMWRVNGTSHAKIVLFSTGWCMVGGRNLTTSDWVDFSFWFKDHALRTKLEALFKKRWKTGTTV